MNEKTITKKKETMNEKPTGTADEFCIIGLKLAGFKPKGSLHIQNRRYRANYGVSWDVTVHVWKALKKIEAEAGEHGAIKLQQKHLLWCLNFFKCKGRRGL